MKLNIKMFLPVAALAATLHSGILSASPVTMTAGNTYPDSANGPNAADASTAAEASFLAGKTVLAFENFEGFAVGNGLAGGIYGSSISTAVGTFKQTLQGGGGACLNCNMLAVLDNDSSPFNGRYDNTAGGKNWLDSNDSKKMELDFGSLAPVYNFGFYLTDANDSGGRLRILFNDGTMDDQLFGGAGSNGRRYYIAYEGGAASIAPALSVSKLEFIVNKPNGTGTVGADGFGIDNFTVASQVPEPGTYALLGTGLLGLVTLARRKKA